MPKVLDEEAFDELIGPVCLIADLEPATDWPDELKALVDAARHVKTAFRFHAETSAMDVTTDCRIDAAYAEGVKACLQRLYAADARRDEHDMAWEDCEAMSRNRMNAVFEARAKLRRDAGHGQGASE